MSAVSTTTDDINGLGPFDIKSLTMAVVADVVVNQRAPMVVSEVSPVGHINYAVIANSNTKLVCSGCFKEGMTLMDTSRCRMCSSFVKHWNTKDGVRRSKCTNTPEDIDEVALTCPKISFGFGTGTVQVTDVSTDVLIEELRKRDGDLDTLFRSVQDTAVDVQALADDVIKDEMKRRKLLTEDYLCEELETEDLVAVGMRRGIGFVLDARPQRLIHELRRQCCDGGNIETYYEKPKKKGRPNATDEITVKIYAKIKDITGPVSQIKKITIDGVLPEVLETRTRNETAPGSPARHVDRVSSKMVSEWALPVTIGPLALFARSNTVE